MDHLPKFKDASDDYPSVPFLGQFFECDASYEDFPVRHGWDKAQLEQGNFTQGHHDHATAAFLQSWLYFGLIQELSIASHRRPPKIDDFITNTGGPQSITAKRLDAFVHRHAIRIARFHEKKKNMAMERLNAVLHSARRVTKRLWELQSGRVCQSSLHLEILVSIMVLGCTIDHGLVSTQLIEHSPGWQLSAVAKTLMYNRGWCRRDVCLASTHLTEVSMYCAAYLKRAPPDDRHQRCTDHRCEADQVDDRTYKTQHHLNPNCNCGVWHVDEEELQKIIRQGRIPYIRLKKAKRRGSEEWDDRAISPSLESLKNSIPEGPHNRLVIFSHVWSDGSPATLHSSAPITNYHIGLGNSRHNALHMCQLEYFYDMLIDSPWEDVIASQSVSHMGDGNPSGKPSSYHGTFPPAWLRKKNRKLFNKSIKIWIDTLCIPLEDETRNMAIRMLKRYYSFACMTVVLDKELYQLQHKNMSRTELLLRVGFSGWMRRCWTMEEAVISAGNLRVRFNDGWLDLPDLVAFLRHPNNISVFLMNDEQQKTVETVLRGTQAVCVPLDAVCRLLTAPQKLTDFCVELVFVRGPKRLYRAVRRQKIPSTSDTIFLESKGLFASIIDLCQPSLDPDRLHDHTKRIKLAWQGLSFRTTSKPTDRFIIFAFASAKVKKDFQLMREVLTEPSSKRLQYWLQRQEALPSGLMFVDGPRMSVPGYRWAPNDIHSSTLKDDSPATTVQAKNQLGTPEGSLQLKKPGITVNSPVLTGEDVLQITESREKIAFIVELDWTSSPDDRRPLTGCVPLAVVLSQFSGPDISSPIPAAVLGKVKRQEETYIGEFICRCQVSLVGRDPERSGSQVTLAGELLKNDQIWIVT